MQGVLLVTTTQHLEAGVQVLLVPLEFKTLMVGVTAGQVLSHLLLGHQFNTQEAGLGVPAMAPRRTVEGGLVAMAVAEMAVAWKTVSGQMV
jgi:hypothetical protein